jgi:hypothetical protein
MKPSNIFKIVLALVAIICVAVGFCGIDIGADTTNIQTAGMGMVATLPLVATFNFDNLKMPKADFEALQAKHGKLYVLDVVIDESEKYQFAVCRPSRATISAIAANKDNLTKANDIIIKNMVVGGDLEALDDGIVFARVLKELGGIVKQGQSFLTKA